MTRNWKLYYDEFENNPNVEGNHRMSNYEEARGRYHDRGRFRKSRSSVGRTSTRGSRPRSGSSNLPSGIEEQEWFVVEEHLKKIGPKVKKIGEELSKLDKTLHEAFEDFQKTQTESGIRLDIYLDCIALAKKTHIRKAKLFHQLLELHSVAVITAGSDPVNVGSTPTGAIGSKSFTINVKEP